MKKTLIGLATSLAFASAASGAVAADPSYYPAPAPTIDWAGLYIGAHGGYTSARTDWNVGPGFPISIAPDGLLGGGLLGYNLQFNSFVFGLEGDFSVGDIDEGPGNFNIGGLQSANVNWLATIRGRLGYAFNDWMIYATGGFDFADLELYDSLQAPARDRQTLTGYVLGAGAEAKLDRLLNIDTHDALSARLEYMYGNYGSENFQIGGTREPADLENHTIRAAVIWRFNGTGGVFQ